MPYPNFPSDLYIYIYNPKANTQTPVYKSRPRTRLAESVRDSRRALRASHPRSCGHVRVRRGRATYTATSIHTRCALRLARPARPPRCTLWRSRHKTRVHSTSVFVARMVARLQQCDYDQENVCTITSTGTRLTARRVPTRDNEPDKIQSAPSFSEVTHKRASRNRGPRGRGTRAPARSTPTYHYASNGAEGTMPLRACTVRHTFSLLCCPWGTHSCARVREGEGRIPIRTLQPYLSRRCRACTRHAGEN